MKKAISILYLLIICFVGISQPNQVLNPTFYQPFNKSVLVNGARINDAKYKYLDPATLLERAYKDTTEVRIHIPLLQRANGLTVLVNSGGVLSNGVISGGVNSEWWYKNGVLDSNLIVKQNGGGSTSATDSFWKSTPTGIQNKSGNVIINGYGGHFTDTMATVASSIENGSSSSAGLDSSYPLILKNYFGLVFQNLAQPGRGSFWGAKQMNQKVNPGHSKLGLVQTSFNDVRAGDYGQSKTYRKIMNGFLAITFNHWLKSYEAPTGGAHTQMFGSWATNWNDTSHGAKNTKSAYTVTLNDSIHHLFTDSTVVLQYAGSDGTQVYSSVDVYIDYVFVETFSQNNQTDGIGDGIDNNRVQLCSRAWTGLSNTSHVITLINKTSGGAMTIYGFGHFVDAASAKPLIWVKPFQLNTTGYAVPAATGGTFYNNTIKSAVGTSLDSLKLTLPVSYRPYVTVVATPSLDIVTGFVSDSVHPNDRGHGEIARDIESQFSYDEAGSLNVSTTVVPSLIKIGTSTHSIAINRSDNSTTDIDVSNLNNGSSAEASISFHSVSNNVTLSSFSPTKSVGMVGNNEGLLYSIQSLNIIANNTNSSIKFGTGASVASHKMILTSAGTLGIGSGITPSSSAILDIQPSGANKGLLIPRLTTAQMNAVSSPATALMIYNTDSSSTGHPIMYYTGSAWLAVGQGAALLNFNGLFNITSSSLLLRTTGVQPLRTSGDTALCTIGLAKSIVIDSAKSTRYTPTLTVVANITGTPTVGVLTVLRVGSSVTISGRISFNATTTSTETKLRISLPYASNFTNESDAGGTGSLTSAQSAFAVKADTTNDELLIDFNAIVTGPVDWWFTATYSIL